MDDVEIARRALDRGLITTDQLREALSYGSRKVESGAPPRDVESLLGILMERGFLTREQVDSLKRESEPAASPSPESGDPGLKSVGRYLLVNKIGEGRTGSVWRAWQKDLRRWVAVRIPPSGTRPGPFLDGARKAALLEHPSILRTFEAGSEGGTAFLAAEFLKARPLDDVPGLTRDAAIRILAEAADALEIAHGRGVLHGNLKPSNIFLVEGDAPGSSRRAVVSDFAIPAPGVTPYSPPEIVAHGSPPSVRGDVYSLGALLYYATTHRPPYHAPNPAHVASQIVRGGSRTPRAFDPAFPPRLEAVILRAMARDPAQRYASAAEFAQALRELSKPSSVSPARRRRTRVAARPPPRRPSYLAPAVYLIAGLLVLTALLLALLL